MSEVEIVRIKTSSPNWLQNNTIHSIIDTFVWISYTDAEKKNILNQELNDYFL